MWSLKDFGRHNFHEVEITQGSAEWLELRKNHIGASDIPIIMGVSPFGEKPYDLWLEKTGRREARKTNGAMQRGKDMEPIARQAYIDKYGRNMKATVLVHNTLPIIFSLDGVSNDDKIVLEIKNPLYAKSVEAMRNTPVRTDYLVQVQAQLLGGFEVGHLFLYHPDCEDVLKEVLPDVKFQSTLIEHVEKFWYMVEHDIEPEHDKKSSEEYKEVEETLDYTFAVERLLEGRDMAKKGKSIEDEAKEEILSYTGKCNFQGGRIKGTLKKGVSRIDWDAVKIKYNIKDKDLAEFTIHGEPYIKIDVLKS